MTDLAVVVLIVVLIGCTVAFGFMGLNRLHEDERRRMAVQWQTIRDFTSAGVCAFAVVVLTLLFVGK